MKIEKSDGEPNLLEYPQKKKFPPSVFKFGE